MIIGKIKYIFKNGMLDDFVSNIEEDKTYDTVLDDSSTNKSLRMLIQTDNFKKKLDKFRIISDMADLREKHYDWAENISLSLIKRNKIEDIIKYINIDKRYLKWLLSISII